MTQKQHSIAPPQWQMDAWQARIETMGADVPSILLEVIQWGREQANADIERKLQEAADQELEACCDYLRSEIGPLEAARFRVVRRPKPPSLKEEAMRVLVENGVTLDGRMELEPEDIDTIRRAIEQLPDEQ